MDEKVFDYERDRAELIRRLDFILGTEREKEEFLETFLRSLVFV